ncbi:hypothetical protein NC652_018409 [Populus alba x Populus x berolinensis]|nr:hypothetical protein NC652_018409 [Populus alba x Populus x berolinensis]
MKGKVATACLELIATWTGTFSGMKGGESQAHPVLTVAAAACRHASILLLQVLKLWEGNG